MYWKGETTSLAFYGGDITCFYEDDPETIKGMDNILYYTATMKVIVEGKSCELHQDDSLFILDLANILENIHKNPVYLQNEVVGDDFFNFKFEQNLRTLTTADYDVDIVSCKAHGSSFDPDHVNIYHRVHVYEGFSNFGFSCTFVIFDEEIPSLVKAINDFTKNVLVTTPKKNFIETKKHLSALIKKGLVQEISLVVDQPEQETITILGEVFKNGSFTVVRGFKVKKFIEFSDLDEYEHYSEMSFDSTDNLISTRSVSTKEEVWYHKMRANALETENYFLKNSEPYAPKQKLKG